MFDELHSLYYPKIPELRGNRVTNYEETYPWDFNGYEIWYYYIYAITARFCNNYYEYENYRMETFSKNILTALKKYCNAVENRAIEMVREELLDCEMYVHDNNLRDDEFRVLFMEAIWDTNVGCCEKCEKLDGKSLEKCEKIIKNSKKNVNRLELHPNCHCGIVIHSWYQGHDGEHVDEQFIKI